MRGLECPPQRAMLCPHSPRQHGMLDAALLPGTSQELPVRLLALALAP